MKVEIETLCKYASDSNGSLTIVETFDRVVADKFPCKTDFFFVFKVNVEGLPVGPYGIKVDIVKDSDENVKVFDGLYNYTMKETIETVTFTSNLKGLVFDAMGLYKVRVSFNEEIIITHPLKLLLKNG